MSSSSISHILIIGGGISGLCSALSLNALGIRCTVYELRDIPSTIGGAVNLTPNALGILDRLGVMEQLEGQGCITRRIQLFSLEGGYQYGELTFENNAQLGYHNALRIPRGALLKGILSCLSKKGITVEYGKKLVSIEEKRTSVQAKFLDGTTATGDILLGCDGIHSAVRTTHVDHGRLPVYTGISAAYGFLPTSSISSPIHFVECGVNTAKQGLLLTAYSDRSKETVYLNSVTPVKGQGDAGGQRARGSDQVAIKAEMKARFKDAKDTCLLEMIEKVDDLYLYPISRLESNGRWSTERVILLGDAAHAMPPQGESIGLALEDTALFSRVVEVHQAVPVPISSLFSEYETLRRPAINAAISDAEMRWDNMKVKGVVEAKIFEWMSSMYLWWTKEKRAASWGEDIRDLVAVPTK